MSWASTLPRARVAPGVAPKAVSLVYPYYENAAFLRRQMEGWRRLPVDVTRHLSLMVVDDGSPASPAADVLSGEWLPFPVRMFRVGVDVPWNWLAARNIGAHHVSSDCWVLMTDMDHVAPEATLRALIHGAHDPSVMYAFSRVEHTGEALAPHSASFFLTRALFWAIGGYDEALSGHYGTDGDWRRRAAAAARIELLDVPLVRHEYVEDSSTTRYARKLPSDASAVQRLVSTRTRGWRPRTLSFPYHEVSL